MRNIVIGLILGIVSAAAAQEMKSPAREESRAPEQVISSSNRDTEWRPTLSQTDTVQRQTMSYFAMRDAGRVDEVYARFSPTQKAMVPFDVWRASMEAFNSK